MMGELARPYICWLARLRLTAATWLGEGLVNACAPRRPALAGLYCDVGLLARLSESRLFVFDDAIIQLGEERLRLTQGLPRR
jgi:hypothetical protein